MLNTNYVAAQPLNDQDEKTVMALLKEHERFTGSELARRLIGTFEPKRFSKVQTKLMPEKFV
jgi:glutamate synthase domain-containing protein 3